MNILITGASGFIGGRLVDYFVKDPSYKVFYSSRNFLNLQKQFSLAHNISLNWQSLDTSFDLLSKIDILIHCAGINSSDSEKNPDLANQFNHLATKRLAEISARAGVRKFIYLSTAHVYESFLNRVISESTPIKNNHPYARSHYLGEMALLDVAIKTKMQGVVVRLSNIFGVPINMNSKAWSLVVNDLCYQAVCNKAMVLKTNGLVRRDLISIDEVLKVVKFLVDLDFKNTNENIFNVGSGISRSVLEVADLINEINFGLSGSSVPIKKNIEDMTLANENFFYKNSNLDKLGIKINDDISEVVESILIKCYKNFCVINNS